MRPLVSIITPSYNSEGFIKETIESVLNQTYTNWEMIIIDDCSTDNSPEIIKEYMKIDSRIKYLKNKENSGPAISRNLGLDNSKGEYIAFLDSDDVWFKEKLQIQMEYIIKNKTDILHNNYYFCDENGKIIKEVKNDYRLNYKKILKSNQIKTSFLIVKKEVLKNIRFQNIKHEDYAFFLDFLRENNECFCISKPLGKYRINSTSVSSNKLRSAIWTWKIYRNYEKFNLIKASYYFINYALNGILKYRRM